LGQPGNADFSDKTLYLHLGSLYGWFYCVHND